MQAAGSQRVAAEVLESLLSRRHWLSHSRTEWVPLCVALDRAKAAQLSFRHNDLFAQNLPVSGNAERIGQTAAAIERADPFDFLSNCGRIDGLNRLLDDAQHPSLAKPALPPAVPCSGPDSLPKVS